MNSHQVQERIDRGLPVYLRADESPHKLSRIQLQRDCEIRADHSAIIEPLYKTEPCFVAVGAMRRVKITGGIYRNHHNVIWHAGDGAINNADIAIDVWQCCGDALRFSGLVSSRIQLRATRCKGVGIVLSGERQSNNIQLDWCKWTNCSESFIQQYGMSRLVHGSIWAEDNDCNYLIDVFGLPRLWRFQHCWFEHAAKKDIVHVRTDDARADVFIADSRE